MGRVHFRVSIVNMLALLALSMSASLPVSGQESAEQNKPPAHEVRSSEKTYSWTKVADGLWEAHISRFRKDPDEKNKPEFAVLRLSSEKYEDFQKDRKEFLNKHKIFGANVKKQALFTPPPEQAVDPEPEEYYVIVAHWPGSTAAVTVYAGGSEPK
jgi:hypothetical protein